MTYTKQTWHDAPATDTPLSAARLSHMEDGIADAVPSSRKVNDKSLSDDVTLDKSDIGLDNVDNTSDASKPLSTAATAALAEKVDKTDAVTGSAAGAATSLTLWTGTDEQFAALSAKDSHTVYVRPGGISIGETGVYTGVPRTYTVTVDHTKVPADLTDFPLFVDLSDMPALFSAVKFGGNGGDIRCYAGSTELPREVVSCDPVAKTGELHVKCDLSSTADTVITITVDGQSSDYAATDSFGRNAVWSNGFVVVSHDGGLTDSTGNGLNGTVVGSIGGQVNGKLGNTSQEFVGQGYIIIGNDPELKIDNGTLSLWMQDSDTDIQQKNVIVKAKAYGLSASPIILYSYSWGPPVGSKTVAASNLSDGSWHYVANTFQSGVTDGSSIFLDGVDLLDYTMSILNQDNAVSVGGYNPLGDGSEITDARFDEVRIANIARSAAWIATECANQNKPADFYTVAMT